MDGLKKIISEELYKKLLMCEVKIQVKDYKKQGKYVLVEGGESRR